MTVNRDVERILKSELRNVVEAKLEAVHGVQCSLNADRAKCISEGLGAICTVWQICVHWKGPSRLGGRALPETVLLKTPRLADKSELICKLNELLQSHERDVNNIPVLFNDNEAKVYELFESVGDVPVPRPKCYCAEKMDSPFGGLIVMEDLTASATIIEDISSGMSFSQVCNICTCLADFHSWCLTTAVEWQHRFPVLFPVDEMKDELGIMVKGGVDRLKLQFPERFDDVDDQLILTNLIKWPTITDQLAIGMAEVLCHGDLWTNNILFKRNDDGTAGDDVTALIDWQLCSKGSPIQDICHLLVWSTSLSFRRQYQKTIVTVYYNKLRRNLAGKVYVPDFQFFWSAYKAVFPQYAFKFIIVFHALIGTVIKCKGANNEHRLEEMLDRVSGAYHDALEHV